MIVSDKHQIFAANPHKSAEVRKLLIMNRQRLLDFLPAFLADRTDDDQFSDEKAYLVKQIRGLPTQSEEFGPPKTPQQVLSAIPAPSATPASSDLTDDDAHDKR